MPHQDQPRFAPGRAIDLVAAAAGQRRALGEASTQLTEVVLGAHVRRSPPTTLTPLPDRPQHGIHSKGRKVESEMGAGASTTHTTRMDMTAAEAHQLVDQVFTEDAVANGLVRPNAIKPRGNSRHECV